MNKVPALVLHGVIRSSLHTSSHSTEPINAKTSERHRTFNKKPTIGLK
jgi:hypothetical protein